MKEDSVLNSLKLQNQLVPPRKEGDELLVYF